MRAPRLAFAGLVLLLALTSGAQAEMAFPALSGRVVDQAGLLQPQARARLETRLARHEQATGQQVVVVTLPALDGYEIEDFGYQLGRHWGIGRAGEDDGVLLIVALAERRVRIEVGYGLEGTLTDALSSRIIQGAILPAFREGDFAGGIEAGVAALLGVLGEAGAEPVSPPPAREGGNEWLLLLMLLVILPFWFGGGVGMAPGVGRRHGVFLPGPGGFGGGRGGSRGGFGGGFGGGGGGFGGGGASGGW